MLGKTTRDYSILFGPFRLLPTQRVLLEGDKPVRLGSRALDILIALVERRGELVSKRELMSIVWPDTIVVEANLTVHVAALRRSLGDGQTDNRYILNIPGRGYRFVAPVALADEFISPAQRPAPTGRPHNLPIQLTRLIGRDDDVQRLVQQLSKERLVAIIGPGGIGKTAVALDVAERLIDRYEHGVWLIDLAPIADSRLVSTALASALGLEIRSDNPLPGLISAMRDKQILLVLDNCEHVIEAVATLAVELLRSSHGIRVLATSREPLRVEGERIYRLSTLESPPVSAQLNAAAALGFPSIQLFVERAAANMNEFELSDADAPTAGDICRKLDGIPLAIEFAAARVNAFGVRGVAARLDDRLQLLTGGRRTALPRHQTIGAALHWSYQLLSQEEQTVFRRLAIFAGGFTLEAACAVAADADRSFSGVGDNVSSLVMKSLVTASVGNGEARFRLLETTRVYALTKLAESGEVDALGRRHAAYYQDFLEAAWSNSAKNAFAAAYAPEIDNIRAALTWAFTPKGDRSIAVALAAASAPIWLEMSLLTECHGWTGKALELLDAKDRGTRREMVLQCEFGISLMFTQGMNSRARAALASACELAESVQDLDYQLRAIDGLAKFCQRHQDFQGALALGRRAEGLAKSSTDPATLSTADWILGSSLFFLGDYANALTYAQRARRRTAPATRRAHFERWETEHAISARCTIVHILWGRGLLEQSAQAAQELLADVAAGGHPLSVCLALTWCGCIISLRLGDLDAAERSIAHLKDHSEKHALSTFYASGLGFEGQLHAQRGDIATGERLLRSCLDRSRQSQSGTLDAPFLSGLAEVLATAGRLDESLTTADAALQCTKTNQGLWWTPEALRIKGEVLLLSDRVDTTAASEHFRGSLDLARQQGALFWELRTAMSLGRLHHAQGRTRDARDLLTSVYARFAEGFETIDLQRARRFLEAWTPDEVNKGTPQSA